LSHNYPTDLLKEIARQVFIEDPKFLKLGQKDASDDVNGRTMDIEMCCRLPGRDGAYWRQVRHFIATNCPGLLDRTPSPDNHLRRGREVREEMEKQELVQPALNQTL